jgi:hypothetical protein
MARDPAAGSIQQAAPRPVWGRPASPATPERRPATLAERLRAIEHPVWFEARFDDGIISGWLPDREITLGRRIVALGQIHRMRGRPTSEVQLSDGTRLTGPFDGLRHLAVTIGEEPQSLDLSRATEILFATPSRDTGKPALDATVRGEFPSPLPSSQPVNSVHFLRYPGWDIPQASLPDEPPGELVLEAESQESLRITLQVRLPGQSWSSTRCRFELRAPFARDLGVGHYTIPDAAVSFWEPFGTGSDVQTAGSFVVWVLERSEGKVNRLAIDFLLHLSNQGRQETWCGQIRRNASFR